MLNKTKTNVLKKQRASVLCGILLGAALSLLPSSAGAQCARWDANGEWNILQQGVKNSYIKLTLEQKGKVVTGTANFTGFKGEKQYGSGTVDGTIYGDNFSVQIFWNSRKIGVYNAKILASGRLDGEAYEKESPNVRPTWHSVGVLKCAQAAAPSKPFKITSKITLPNTTPPPSGNKTPTIEPPAPKLEPPYIIASPAKPQHLGALMGFGILTWDGGPDHPYAEVWVKVNGADETFVVEQAKGSRQVIVELGKTYLYILTDAGKTLATVGVVLQPF